jgi:hypothetical protein
MRCQDFERLMLESGERELVPEEQLALEEHLETCRDCAAFRSFRGGLRNRLRETAGPALSVDLSDSVRFRCRAELDSLARSHAGRDFGSRPAAVPWPILAALLVLTGLTLCFVIPAVEEFRQNQKVTFEMVLVFIVLLQNALMLFSAPVLLRQGRLSQFHF